MWLYSSRLKYFKKKPEPREAAELVTVVCGFVTTRDTLCAIHDYLIINTKKNEFSSYFYQQVQVISPQKPICVDLQ